MAKPLEARGEAASHYIKKKKENEQIFFIHIKSIRSTLPKRPIFVKVITKSINSIRRAAIKSNKRDGK